MWHFYVFVCKKPLCLLSDESELLGSLLFNALMRYVFRKYNLEERVNTYGQYITDANVSTPQYTSTCFYYLTLLKGLWNTKKNPQAKG